MLSVELRCIMLLIGSWLAYSYTIIICNCELEHLRIIATVPTELSFHSNAQFYFERNGLLFFPCSVGAISHGRTKGIICTGNHKIFHSGVLWIPKLRRTNWWRYSWPLLTLPWQYHRALAHAIVLVYMYHYCIPGVSYCLLSRVAAVDLIVTKVRLVGRGSRI